MIHLAKLTNTHRPTKKRYRVGRGMGSKCGKTCGRGAKGDKSRRGYKNHFGQEGGQIPLYKKLPTRGFTNGRFKNEIFAINLGMLDKFCADGDVVTLQLLQEKGYAPRRAPSLKILSAGELTKKVTLHAQYFSKAAEEKLKMLNIAYQRV